MSYLNVQKQKNIDFILKEIQHKKSSEPYFADNQLYSIRNEYGQFPHPFWFKGDPTSDSPVIADRETGWIPKNIKKPIIKPEKTQPNIFFQAPCSIVYP